MEPKHTWEFEPDSRLLRYYKRVWGADPMSADFCKLFWSVVLAPIGVLFVWPGHTVGARRLNAVLVWLDAWYAARQKAKPPQAVVEETGPNGAERFLEGVGHFFSNHTARLIARGTAWALMVALAIGATGAVVYVIATNPLESLVVLGIMLACLAVAGLLFLLAVLLVKRSADRAERGLPPRRPLSKAAAFFTRLGHFLDDGYHAVKSNTCPQIVVKGEQPATSGNAKTASA